MTTNMHNDAHKHSKSTYLLGNPPTSPVGLLFVAPDHLATESLRRRVLQVSRNGKLSYCEWLAAGAPADWYSQQCHAERAFDTLDVQRHGYIRAEDLCQLLPKAPLALTVTDFNV